MRRRFFNLIRPYRNLLQPEFTQFHSEFTEFHSKIKWICLDLNKFNATPNLLDSINQWRAGNLLHRNLLFISPGQINQLPKRNSMKSSSPDIFFLIPVFFQLSRKIQFKEDFSMDYPSDIFFLFGGAKSMRRRFQCEEDFSIWFGPAGIFFNQNRRNSLGIYRNLLENPVELCNFEQI